jgi:hypothetical protein
VKAPIGCPQKGEAVKYMIMLTGSQRDYEAMSGKPGPGEPAWAPEDFAAVGQFMESFNKSLAESGELIDTYALNAPVHARRIQVLEGAPVVTDGPYAETEEVLAGFWIVDCESFDRATEIAAQLTNTPGPGDPAGRYVDVRPLADSRGELDV